MVIIKSSNSLEIDTSPYFFCRFSISFLNCSFLRRSCSMNCFASSSVSSRFFASAREIVFSSAFVCIVSSNAFWVFGCGAGLDQTESVESPATPKATKWFFIVIILYTNKNKTDRYWRSS